MSHISTTGYSDFKAILEGKHFKDVFYVTDNSTLFIIYAITSDGREVSSSNLITQPGAFTTDFPNAVQLTNGLSF